MRDLFSAVRGVVSPRNNSPVPYSSSRSSSLFAGGSETISGERAYDAYGSVGTLFAIVSQISNAVASTEWHLYRRTSVRDKKRRTEVLNHGFMTVWDRPNPFYTGDLLREQVQQHLDLVGEGVIVLHKIGSIIVEMWPVRPDRIEPVRHPEKFLTGYIYRGPDGEEVPLELDQVIHIKYPNPKDPYRGMGPVQTVLNDIDAARYSAEWNRNFFINGARPGGIIKVDYRMSDNEFNEFVNRWRQQHQGVANAHRVAVLENAEWLDTSFSMSDMQFVELRNLPRELIREAFAFPKPMLGTVDDVNRANAEAGKEIMAENQTIPRLRRWKSVINTFLLPQFANGKSLELDFDDPTPLNHEAADRERNSQSSSARNLVLSGYHPDDVSDAMGLPRMRWVGVPSPASGQPKEGAEESDEEARV
jgi:HK97 family phage portal protein